ncbi:MAG: hypothetical protein HOY79_47350 [Streptomyces sp.]|nr:hypothetical protein [Streptomyces sp.]
MRDSEAVPQTPRTRPGKQKVFVHLAKAPEIVLSVPAKVNPGYEEAERANRLWARQMRLVTSDAATQRFDDSDWGGFTARNYPTAALDDLTLLTGWMSWMGQLDDQQAEGTYRTVDSWLEVIPGLLAVTTSGGAGSHPCQGALETALADLLRRTLPRFTDAWRERFAVHLREIFEGLLVESELSANCVPTSVSDYMLRRRGSAMVAPSMDLIELALGVELPAVVAMSSTYRFLVSAATDLICWHNDLYSLDKEIARGNATNLILVLEEADGMDRSAAVAAVVHRANRRTQEFSEAAQRLPVVLQALGEDASVALRCVEGMQYWIRGNVEWCKYSTRYSQFEQGIGVPEHVEDLFTHDHDTSGAQPRDRG